MDAEWSDARLSYVARETLLPSGYLVFIWFLVCWVLDCLPFNYLNEIFCVMKYLRLLVYLSKFPICMDVSMYLFVYLFIAKIHISNKTFHKNKFVFNDRSYWYIADLFAWITFLFICLFVCATWWEPQKSLTHSLVYSFVFVCLFIYSFVCSLVRSFLL